MSHRRTLSADRGDDRTRAALPELPAGRIERLEREFGLAADQAGLLGSRTEPGDHFEAAADPGAHRYRLSMTAKEKLHRFVDGLSEKQAEAALDNLDRRDGEDADALIEALDNAGSDDEAATREEEEGVRESRAEYRRGEFFEADEIKREIA